MLSLLDKLKRLDTSIDTVSQYSHTGIGMEDLLCEPETIVPATLDETQLCLDHVLRRIDRAQFSQQRQLAKDTITALKAQLKKPGTYEQQMVAIEFLGNFITSKTYTVIVRLREGKQVLAMTHVNLE